MDEGVRMCEFLDQDVASRQVKVPFLRLALAVLVAIF